MLAVGNGGACQEWDYGTLNGYAPEALIGKGAFGSVFRATQASTGQTVAVKVLHRGVDADPEAVQRNAVRFQREARLLARLRHPNIVSLLDTVETESGQLCAIFEYVPGETLGDVLRRRGALPPAEAGRLMGHLLDALTCAHAQGVVHRDIKPQNVMVSDTGSQSHIKLLDFGIGTILRVGDAGPTDLTRTGEFIGTPGYAAPEQLRGEAVGPKSDLYAWGLVFLECLTGVPAVRAPNLASLLHQQLSGADVALPPPVAAHGVGALLRRVLRKDHRDRAGDAGALFAELAQIDLHELVVPPPAPADGSDRGGRAEMTQGTVADWEAAGARARRSQITAMSWSVDLDAASDATDPEAMETLARDQLNLTKDAVTRFGGVIVGALGNRVMAFFGYPTQYDFAARSAATAALAVAEEVGRRNRELASSGLGVEVRIGIHTGSVVISGRDAPMGPTPNFAMRLEGLAQPGEILVSEPTRQLLAEHMTLETMSAPAGDTLTHRLLGRRVEVDPEGPPTARLLVGRTREREAVLAFWSEGASNDRRVPSALLLRGSAGIGKSRLLDELRRHVTSAGHRVHACRCAPEHRHTALFPVLQLLRDRLGVAAEAPERAATTVSAAVQQVGCTDEGTDAVVCSWLGLPASPPQHSPQRRRSMLFQAALRLLEGSEPGAVLLTIEDLHWADPTTIAFLEFALGASTSKPVGIVMTARPELTPPWKGGVGVLEVGPLEPDATRELVVAARAGRPLSSEAAERILARGEGVPLFIEELTRTLVERERHRASDTPVPGTLAELPLTIQQSLAERLDRLGPAAQTARLAAAIGREFSRDVLVAASSRTASAVDVDLAILASAEILGPCPDAPPGAYAFGHALMREVAYDSIAPSASRKLHARIAKALESKYDDFPEARAVELASHHAEAHDFEAAVRWGTRALAASLDRFALPEALANGQLTSSWMAKLGDSVRPVQEVRVNGLRVQALMGVRGWADPEVRGLVTQTLALAGTLDGKAHSDLVLPTLYHSFLYHHVASNRRECREIAERFGALAAGASVGYQAAGYALLGLALHADGDFPQAERALTRALELCEKDADPGLRSVFGLDTAVWAASTLGLVRWFSEGAAAGMACADRALARAREIEHVPSLGMALLYKAIVHQYSQDRPAAQAVTAELLGLAGRYGLPAFEGYAAVIHSWARNEAAAARQVLDILAGMGCRLALHYYRALLADIEAAAGNVDGALAELDVCLEACERYDDKALEPELRRWRANTLLGATPPRVEEACRELERAIVLAKMRGLQQTEAMSRKSLAAWRHGAPDDLAV